MAQGKPGTTLIAFESGHYKEVRGEWKGDSVWSHFQKTDGGMIHVNKDKVEYTETFGNPVPVVELEDLMAGAEVIIGASMEDIIRTLNGEGLPDPTQDKEEKKSRRPSAKDKGGKKR